MQTLKLFPYLVWFEAKRFGAYPLEAIANFIERSFSTGLFILLWITIGQFSGDQSLDTRQIVSYFLIAGGLMSYLYAGMGIAGMFLKLIKNGELSQYLLRPVNVIVYPWALRTGRNLINQITGLIQIVIGLLIAQPDLGGRGLLMLPIVFINALLINAAFNILLGCLAFYFVEIKGFISTFVHIAKLMRGDLMPLFLMPLAIQSILQATPFPASMFHLVGLLQGKTPPTWPQILIGSMWAIGLCFIASLAWRRGLKHYEATGL